MFLFARGVPQARAGPKTRERTNSKSVKEYWNMQWTGLVALERGKKDPSRDANRSTPRSRDERLQTLGHHHEYAEAETLGDSRSAFRGGLLCVNCCCSATDLQLFPAFVLLFRRNGVLPGTLCS